MATAIVDPEDTAVARRLRSLKRLGVFGGAFDPVHKAHIALAMAAKTQFDLDRVLLMPTGLPAHREPSQTSANHRLKMLELAIGGADGLVTDAGDIGTETAAYTYDTLERLAESSKYELFLLIGEDSLYQFTSWHRWREILDLCHLCVAKRLGIGNRILEPELANRVMEFNANLKRPLGRIFYIDTQVLDISSTAIRQGLQQQRDIGDHVAPEVLQYIGENGLYQYD